MIGAPNVSPNCHPLRQTKAIGLHPGKPDATLRRGIRIPWRSHRHGRWHGLSRRRREALSPDKADPHPLAHRQHGGHVAESSLTPPFSAREIWHVCRPLVVATEWEGLAFSRAATTTLEFWHFPVRFSREAA